MESHMLHSIRTFTGKIFDLDDPKPELVCIEDIAHALSMLPRFNGHTLRPYSVAEHSISVAQACPIPRKLAGLLHDSVEAYVGDRSSPVKSICPSLKMLESKIEVAIQAKFEIVLHCGVVKQMDSRALEAEKHFLFEDTTRHAMSQVAAENAFLEMFYRLGGK